VQRFAIAAADALAGLARKSASRLTVRGPAPSPIEKLKNRYRYQIQLRSRDARLVRHGASACRDRLAADARKAGVRILVDVDAVDML